MNVLEKQQRLTELSRVISRGMAVKEMIETKGWREVIEPVLDKMITHVLGGKENGRWHNGALTVKTDKGFTIPSPDELTALIAYKKALTDFHEIVYSTLPQLEQAQNEYKALINEPVTTTGSDYEEVSNAKDVVQEGSTGAEETLGNSRSDYEG